MRQHLYPLDALRFISAFAVMVFHLCFYAWASDSAAVARVLDGAARYEALAPFSWFGWVGVEVFFVISGFVIANSAAQASPMAFLKGRLLRLYPAAWICATLTLIGVVLVGATPLRDALGPYLRSMTLWVRGPWIDGVYWSLAVEVVFYALVFGVLMGRRVLSLAMLPWLLTALSLLYGVFHEAALMGAHVMPPTAERFIEAYSEPLLLRYGSFFAVGVWLWMASEQLLSPARLAGLLVAIALCARETLQRAHDLAGGEVTFQAAYPPIIPLLLWFAACAAIAAVALRPHWFTIKGARAQSALKRIGLMTYPLFLIHSALGAAVIRSLVAAGVDAWLALAVAITGALAAAYVISAFGEVWVRHGFRALLDQADAALRRTPSLAFLFAAAPDRVLARR
ncbi:MAG: acyltransferase family protein [Hyphomonadaceae bacterium]